MDTKVTLNKYGYYELSEKPSPQDLQEYYAMKYYQDTNVGYSNKYSDEEISYINNKITQKYEIIKNLLPKDLSYRMLDIGCGEGWALDYFVRLDWDVLGIDYSDEGCRNHHPHLLEKMIIGDINDNLDELVKNSKKFLLFGSIMFWSMFLIPSIYYKNVKS